MDSDPSLLVSGLLVEHRQADYPDGMYRQPRDVFWHRLDWSGPCSLCDYDDEVGLWNKTGVRAYGLDPGYALVWHGSRAYVVVGGEPSR